MRIWAYKTGESGHPRRFLNHREAAWWVLLKVGKISGTVLLSCVVWIVLWVLASGPSGAPAADYGLILMGLLFLHLLASGAIYIYITLSGGIMSRTDREKLVEKDRRDRRV